jgi:hypothetical protein
MALLWKSIGEVNSVTIAWQLSPGIELAISINTQVIKFKETTGAQYPGY